MNYKVYTIPLDTVRNDSEFDLGGEWSNFMFLQPVSDVIEYRINTITADKVSSKYIQGFENKAFKKLYLSNTAQASKIAVLFVWE